MKKYFLSKIAKAQTTTSAVFLELSSTRVEFYKKQKTDNVNKRLHYRQDLKISE